MRRPLRRLSRAPPWLQAGWTGAKSAWIQQLRLQHPGLGAALVLLKTWAQRRQVYGQSVGFPSGLGFNCLGLFAVQQSLPQVGLVEVPDFAPEAKAWHQEDLSAVPSLVTRIFRFYAEDFDWHSELVSIRLARRSAKAARGDVRVLAIEDPVETYLDLARPYMNQARSELLRREMCAAAASLGSGSWEGFQ
ncbi:unnamed protein product [Effrenium voratum]|uniref:PAP-associated domain-containing protein n=1 Tax=Effrenium voratum TaxID=2562239 RepID=A0AA36J7Z0_9DINO|nr:unnamed protein product [Effrenium voratum]